MTWETADYAHGDRTSLPLNSHFLQFENIGMAQHLQQLHFAQSRDWEAILLVVHQDLLERKDSA